MTQALISIDDLKKKLQQNLTTQRSNVPPSASNKIKLTDEGFELPTGEILESLDTIIVHFAYVNAWYPKRYSPGSVEAPDCFAIDSNFAGLAPHNDASKPVNSECAGCPKNEWGSAPGGGRGKACQNRIRLGIISPDATSKSPIFILDLPPTSIGDFIKLIKKLKVPVQTRVLRFSLDPKVDYQKVLCSDDRQTPDSIAPILLEKMELAVPIVERPYVARE
jgi:hypothetical protein